MSARNRKVTSSSAVLSTGIPFLDGVLKSQPLLEQNTAIRQQLIQTVLNNLSELKKTDSQCHLCDNPKCKVCCWDTQVAECKQCNVSFSLLHHQVYPLFLPFADDALHIQTCILCSPICVDRYMDSVTGGIPASTPSTLTLAWHLLMSCVVAYALLAIFNTGMLGYHSALDLFTWSLGVLFISCVTSFFYDLTHAIEASPPTIHSLAHYSLLACEASTPLFLASAMLYAMVYFYDPSALLPGQSFAALLEEAPVEQWAVVDVSYILTTCLLPATVVIVDSFTVPRVPAPHISTVLAISPLLAYLAFCSLLYFTTGGLPYKLLEANNATVLTLLVFICIVMAFYAITVNIVKQFKIMALKVKTDGDNKDAETSYQISEKSSEELEHDALVNSQPKKKRR